MISFYMAWNSIEACGCVCVCECYAGVEEKKTDKSRAYSLWDSGTGTACTIVLV